VLCCVCVCVCVRVCVPRLHIFIVTLLDPAAQEADAAPADAGPLLVTVTLKAFKDDKKVGVIKEIKRIMAEGDPKFNLAAVSRRPGAIYLCRPCFLYVRCCLH
jgi:hypothetical protein